MTTRKSTSSHKERIPTQLIIDKDIFKERLVTRIQEAKAISGTQISTRSQLEDTERKFYAWDDYNSELLKQSFNNEDNEYKYRYDRVNSFYGFSGDKADSEQGELNDKINNKVSFLEQLVSKIDLIKCIATKKIAVDPEYIVDVEAVKNDIFIVHGHNNEVKMSVERTLSKLALNPIILHDKPNSGKTVIEKFEEHSDVGFAIILLTDDDLGKAKTEENFNIRARQNVILEFGYFIGKLGRKRVCTLYSRGVELPSDLSGLLYIEIDTSGYWKFSLAKELMAAGYSVDLNNII
jgi:predicted nucleotide-binding protein